MRLCIHAKQPPLFLSKMFRTALYCLFSPLDRLENRNQAALFTQKLAYSRPSTNYLFSELVVVWVGEWMNKETNERTNEWSHCTHDSLPYFSCKFIVNLVALVLPQWLHCPESYTHIWLYSRDIRAHLSLSSGEHQEPSFLSFSSEHLCSWKIDWAIGMKKLNVSLFRDPKPAGLS